MSKRCTNCGKYPFCERIENAGEENDCQYWNKREITMLNRVDEGYFEFEKI